MSFEQGKFVKISRNVEVDVNKRLLTGEHQYKTPTALPLFHIYGLTVNCMYHLRLGCQSITIPKFTPDLYINLLRNEKPDVLYVAPPIGKSCTGRKFS